MSEPTLRDATLEDAPVLARLMGALGYPSDEEAVRNGLEAIMAHPDYRTVLAELDGAVVGMVGMRRGLRWEGAPFVQLAALVVDEAAQGRGVGTALVRETEAWARAQGAGMITLNSGHHREAAHRFYKKLGYEPTGLRFLKRLEA